MRKFQQERTGLRTMSDKEKRFVQKLKELDFFDAKMRHYKIVKGKWIEVKE